MNQTSISTVAAAGIAAVVIIACGSSSRPARSKAATAAQGSRCATPIPARRRSPPRPTSAATLELVNAGDGTHVLKADKPVGIQVLGYGDYTTYMFPGGLNLGEIAPIPPK